MNKASKILVLWTLIVAFLCYGKLAAQEETDQAAKSLKVGDKAPDFEAETFDDKTVKLSARFGEDGHPVILLFSRANW